MSELGIEVFILFTQNLFLHFYICNADLTLVYP